MRVMLGLYRHMIGVFKGYIDTGFKLIITQV